MNIAELQAVLKQEDIPDDMYNLNGIGRNDERFCLLKKDNIWEVFFLERGEKTTDMIFNTESDACEYIYKQLID